MSGTPTAPAYPRPDVPRFSVAERDARWARVRDLMRRDGLDAIVVLHDSQAWDQANANGRYLSSIGGNCAWVSVVFPLEGDVTALTGPVPSVEYWQEFQDWVTDIRPAFFNPTPLVVERLLELGLERGRIGVAGLGPVPRVPDGFVTHGAYTLLVERLPDAELVDASGMLNEARFVKSAEEIGMLERAVGLVEDAVEAMVREARPGVPESVVYARMVAALLEGGSEPTSLLLWCAGNPLPPATGTMASRRPLEQGDVIQVEADAKWCGYLGHITTTETVGPPTDLDRELARVQLEATERCWDAFRPGTPLGRFTEICAEAAADTPFVCQPIIHSRGLGFDAPVLVFEARDERTAQWRLEEGSVFVVKPRVATADGVRNFVWGDTVVPTEDGARRLGKRPAPLSS
jgi:Xaa-Pro aminopeptidase